MHRVKSGLVCIGLLTLASGCATTLMLGDATTVRPGTLQVVTAPGVMFDWVSLVPEYSVLFFVSPAYPVARHEAGLGLLFDIPMFGSQ